MVRWGLRKRKREQKICRRQKVEREEDKLKEKKGNIKRG